MGEILTKRLRLEPQLVSHAEAMFGVLSVSAIYLYENQAPQSVEWLRNRFMKLETRESPNGSEKWLNWVARPPSGEPIGFVQATVNTDHHANIAYVFSSQHWGQGLAFESVEAMIAELVDQFKVNSLSAVLKTNNVQSLRLLERLNFALATLPASIEADEILIQRKL